MAFWIDKGEGQCSKRGQRGSGRPVAMDGCQLRKGRGGHQMTDERMKVWDGEIIRKKRFGPRETQAALGNFSGPCFHQWPMFS